MLKTSIWRPYKFTALGTLTSLMYMVTKRVIVLPDGLRKDWTAVVLIEYLVSFPSVTKSVMVVLCLTGEYASTIILLVSFFAGK